MKKIILPCFILLVSFVSHAQKTKTVELKPIHYKGFAYYYDFKKVHGGAYGLQIPLESINDPEVTRYYNGFRGWNQFAGLVNFIPLAYLVYGSYSNTGFDNQTFVTVLLGSFATSLICVAVGHGKAKRAVDRYNIIILKDAGARSYGAGLTIRI